MDRRPNEPKQLTKHDIAEQKHVLEDKTVKKQRMLENTTTKCSNCWTKLLTEHYISEDQTITKHQIAY